MAENTSFKLVVVGDITVGRTWLVRRFIHKDDVNFPNTGTIGMELDIFSIEGRDCNRYKLHIWELAGQERYFGFVGSCFRGASSFLLLFDVTR